MDQLTKDIQEVFGTRPRYAMYTRFGDDAVDAIVRSAKVLKWIGLLFLANFIVWLSVFLKISAKLLTPQSVNVFMTHSALILLSISETK